MEDDVAEVSLTLDTVRLRAAQLDDLQAQLETLVALVRGVHNEQGTARWTAVPECRAFAQAYAGSLGQLENHLARLRRQVEELRVDLKASARALVRTDEEAQALMQQLNSRFGGSDPAPGAPTVPTVPAVPATADAGDSPASPFGPRP